MLIRPPSVSYLRDYQGWAFDKLFAWFETNKTGNPLIVLPTGTGKAVLLAAVMHAIVDAWPTQRLLASTHVKELIQQNYNKLMHFHPLSDVGIYSAGVNRYERFNRITFAGIQSIAKKAGALFGHVDLMFIDEAHLLSPVETTAYQMVIAELTRINPKLRVIGLTATPWRLGHGSLIENHIFTHIAFDASTPEAFNWFIDQGYLAPLIPGTVDTKLKLDGVHKRGGEYIEGELQRAVNKDEITEVIVDEIIAHGHNRNSWLAFASGVDHAERMAYFLNERGVATVAIHSKMKGDRTKALEAYLAGYYKCAVNNNVLTTGFDHPGLDLIAMVRPTESTVLWVQMLGRGTRPDYVDGFDLSTQDGRLASIAASDKQNTLVLDFAGNTRRLGPINDPVIPRAKGKGTGDAPVKECPQCRNEVHASLRRCPCINKDGSVCDYEFPIQNKLHFVASTQALVKTTGQQLPVIEIVRVNHITYSPKTSLKDKLPMVKVTYYCEGNKSYEEHVLAEHKPDPATGRNPGRNRARHWWKARTGDADDLPDTCAEILEHAQELPQPTHIRVWTNKGDGKWPEITEWDFSGTGWKTMEKTAPPEVKVSAGGSVFFHTEFAKA